MNFARSLSSARIVWPAAACVLLGPAAALSQAPAGLDVQDSQQALTLMGQGKYAEAAKLYEGIPLKYPTSVMIPEASFRLGYIAFMTGDYDKSIAILQKTLTLKNVPPDITELSYSFIPQILVAKASKLAPADPGRKAAFLAAVKEFDTFIGKFPQSEEIEAVNYGKARALYSVENFEDAAKALRLNLTKFPQSPSLQDTQFMLAVVLATQAGVSMQKTSGSDAAATANYDEAGKLLGDIISKRSDVALGNDAQFQLAEMLAARGALEEDHELQATIFQRALTAYRAVLPKELVLKAQEDRIALIAQRKQELARTDLVQFKKVSRFLEKEQEKTAAIAQRPDQILPAKFKCAQVYLSLQKFDECRVLLRYVEPQLTEPEQKKQWSYFLTVSYAAQNLTKKALPEYEKFFTSYKNDPIAENLPLLMGLAFSSNDEPEKAIKYYKEQSQRYPKSHFTGDAAMREALALIPLERYDEALKVLEKFLAGGPNKEQAAAAELGLATIYQKTGKLDEAIKSYESIRSKYPKLAEAEQASYWVAQLRLTKGDAKKAVTDMKAFISAFPKSPMVPGAMLVLGQAQAAAGDQPGALKTFEETAKKFPENEAGSVAYFQRAGIFQKNNDLDQVVVVMKEFMAAYPKSERLFTAADYVAQIHVMKKAPQDAIAVYTDFVKNNSGDAEAPKALIKAAALWKKSAEQQEKLGRYSDLKEQARNDWRTGVENALANNERVLESYPESAEAAIAVQNLLATYKMQVKAKLKTEKDVQDYLEGLAKKFSDKPSTKTKIKFTLAGYLLELNGNKGEKEAVSMMTGAYDEKLVYAPADLDLYGSALLRSKNLAEAQKVYQKLAVDNPIPPNTPQDKVPRSIGEAQAMALYGAAKILQAQGKVAESAAKFEELKTKYPFSNKLLEAEYGIAEGEVNKKEYDVALKRLKMVAGATGAPTNLRARAMFLMGKLCEAQGKTDDAINNYQKVGDTFESEVELAPEGYWRAAQLIEAKLKK